MTAVLVSLCAAGCVGVTHPASYPEDVGRLTADMVSCKQGILDFKIPLGWSPVPASEALPSSIALPRPVAVAAGPLAFRKADRGALIVWCVPLENNEFSWGKIKGLINDLVPANVPVGDTVEVDAPGQSWLSKPSFYRFDAVRVEQGQRRDFSLFMSMKSGPTFSLSSCNYAAIGRAASSADRAEIESDFVAVLRSLK